MRQTFFEALLLIIAALILGVAYTNVTHQGFFTRNQSVQPAEKSSLDMISLADAKKFFESHNAVFVDARHEFDFQAGHIPGAVNVPLKLVDTRLAQLNKISKGKLLVVYCDGAECNSSIELAVKLMASGFTSIKVFFGGWQEWITAGLPTEKE